MNFWLFLGNFYHLLENSAASFLLHTHPIPHALEPVLLFLFLAVFFSCPQRSDHLHSACSLSSGHFFCQEKTLCTLSSCPLCFLASSSPRPSLPSQLLPPLTSRPSILHDDTASPPSPKTFRLSQKLLPPAWLSLPARFPVPLFLGLGNSKPPPSPGKPPRLLWAKGGGHRP